MHFLFFHQEVIRMIINHMHSVETTINGANVHFLDGSIVSLCSISALRAYE